MMKLKIFILFCLSFYFGIANLYAQTKSEKEYFVVIGEFSKLDDAVKLTEEANRKGFNAQYALHDKMKYYVYLLQTSEQNKAKNFLDHIRKETDYKKAWLYKGKL